MNGDIETVRISLNRKEFDDANNNLGSHVELHKKSKIQSVEGKPLYKIADFKPRVKFPEFRWNMSLD